MTTIWVLLAKIAGTPVLGVFPTPADCDAVAAQIGDLTGVALWCVAVVAA